MAKKKTCLDKQVIPISEEYIDKMIAFESIRYVAINLNEVIKQLNALTREVKKISEEVYKQRPLPPYK
jgi:hypothetical protein